MTPEDKELVRISWAAVVPIQETAAELFYKRLFEQHPDLQPLFKGDMKLQGEKLVTMLDQAVGSLDKLDSLIEPLKRAGLAHKFYGVKEADYDKVADALLWTLETGLGEAFTQDVKKAWATAYETLATVMIEGAQYHVSNKVEVSTSIPWWKRMLGRKAA